MREHSKIALAPWQYRITRSPHPGARRINRLWISHADDLPFIPVTDATGQQVGGLLGFPIDLPTETCVTTTWQSRDNSAEGILKSLATLAGRFLWICDTQDQRRIYPDSATQLSCVWDRETHSAGASAFAILDEADYAQRFDHTQFATLCQDHIGWFPAGLTAHAGVTRLLPNHYLDLDTWSAQRFDMRTIVTPVTGPESSIDLIIEVLDAQIAALVTSTKPTFASLTGGYATRTLLACARQRTQDITFLTVEQPSFGRQDVTLSQQIAQDQRLRHRIFEVERADRAGQERYLRRSGHATADANLACHPTLSCLSRDATLLGGTGADIARAKLWFEDDDANTTVTPDVLLSRLGLQGTEKTLRWLDWWLDGLAGECADRILDLAYLENRLAPSSMAQLCANPGPRRFAPFLTYPTLVHMQALPLEWKQSNALHRAIIGRLWPELLTYPIHTADRLGTLLQGSHLNWQDRVDALRQTGARRA